MAESTSPFPLKKLPEDLLAHVAVFLPSSDVASLTRTSKTFASDLKKRKVMERIAPRELPGIVAQLRSVLPADYERAELLVQPQALPYLSGSDDVLIPLDMLRLYRFLIKNIQASHPDVQRGFCKEVWDALSEQDAQESARKYQGRWMKALMSASIEEENPRLSWGYLGDYRLPFSLSRLEALKKTTSFYADFFIQADKRPVEWPRDIASLLRLERYAMVRTLLEERHPFFYVRTEKEKDLTTASVNVYLQAVKKKYYDDSWKARARLTVILPFGLFPLALALSYYLIYQELKAAHLLSTFLARYIISQLRLLIFSYVLMVGLLFRYLKKDIDAPFLRLGVASLLSLTVTLFGPSNWFYAFKLVMSGFFKTYACWELALMAVASAWMGFFIRYIFKADRKMGWPLSFFLGFHIFLSSAVFDYVDSCLSPFYAAQTHFFSYFLLLCLGLSMLMWGLHKIYTHQVETYVAEIEQELNHEPSGYRHAPGFEAARAALMGSAAP